MSSITSHLLGRGTQGSGKKKSLTWTKSWWGTGSEQCKAVPRAGIARNDILSLKWIYYGPKRDILDYWETLIFFI